MTEWPAEPCRRCGSTTQAIDPNGICRDWRACQKRQWDKTLGNAKLDQREEKPVDQKQLMFYQREERPVDQKKLMFYQQARSLQKKADGSFHPHKWCREMWDLLMPALQEAGLEDGAKCLKEVHLQMVEE